MIFKYYSYRFGCWLRDRNPKHAITGFALYYVVSFAASVYLDRPFLFMTLIGIPSFLLGIFGLGDQLFRDKLYKEGRALERYLRD